MATDSAGTVTLTVKSAPVKSPLICTTSFRYAGCRFIRGRSRVSASHPAARACPEAFALPSRGDGRLGARPTVAGMARARWQRWRQSEDALWRDLDALLADGRGA